MPLIRTPQIADPDGFFEELVDAQRDLPDADAQRLLARLLLLLANHVGDREVLGEAIRVARGRPVRVDPAARPAPVERPVFGSGPVPPPARGKGPSRHCQDFLMLSPDRATMCAAVARSRHWRGTRSGFAPPPDRTTPAGLGA